MGGEVESSGFLAGYRLLNREIAMRLKKPREDDKVPRDQQQWKAVTSLSLIDKKRELCHQKETRSGADQKVHQVEAMALQKATTTQTDRKKARG